CCAPNLENGLDRCKNQTVSDQSDHCKLHQNYSNELYLHYKQVCKIAYDLDIEKEISNTNKRIKYLTECQLLFEEAWKARKKHRNYAYVPECYDSGHNFQFTYIEEKMNRCNN